MTPEEKSRTKSSRWFSQKQPQNEQTNEDSQTR
jgi:hypothetical protein